MPLLLYFLSLFIHEAIGKMCDNGYTLYESEDLCLAVSNVHGWLSQAESTCRDQMNGGVPFVRRMSDELFKEFGEKVTDMARRGNAIDAFVGMQKDSGFDSKKWIYNNNEGSVEQGDFPYWASKPMTEDCGVMRISENFKIVPMGCGQNLIALCEKKEKPCYKNFAFYAEYYGRCLSPSNEKAGYPAVENFCSDGYVVPVKDDDILDAAAAALFSFPAPIYNGLRKDDAGRWKYDDGEEEVDRFEPGNPGETDCGVLGLKRDNSIAIFTADCQGQYRVICEMKDV